MSLWIFLPKEKIDNIAKLIQHKLDEMNSLSLDHSFAPPILSSALLILTRVSRIGEDQPISVFRETDLIRELKNPSNRLENYPWFFRFHSDLFDSSTRDHCTVFSRGDSEECPNLVAINSVAMFPVISALWIYFQRVIQKIPSPPDSFPIFFLSKLRLDLLPRPIYLPLAWYLYLTYFFCVKIPVNMCGRFKRFLLNWCFSPLFHCVIFIICCGKRSSSSRGYTRIPDSQDIESNRQTLSDNETYNVSNRTEHKENSRVEEKEEEEYDDKRKTHPEDSLPENPSPEDALPELIIIPSNNEQLDLNLMDSLKELEALPNVSPENTFSDDTNVNKELKEYEEQITQVVDDSLNDPEFHERNAKLSEENQKQREQLDSWDVEDETRSFDDNEAIKEENEKFRNEIEEQNRRHAEEMELLRQQREERRKKYDEELYEMKQESRARMKALLFCIQLKGRFEEKEQEWSDILAGFRAPLVKVTNSYYSIQEEFRRTKKHEDSSDIIFELRYFANLVQNAQYGLAQSFDNLSKMSENHGDRIFLKMIMKSISLEGQKCDTVGYQILNLMNSPLDPENQKSLDDAVSKLNAHSIPTTGSLKTNSKTARPEDYLNIEEAPLPDWHSKIS